MNEPLDELYLKWLYRLIESNRFRNPSRTYWKLTRKLYTKEFVWYIPNDDNRVEDGKDLRYEFIDDCKLQDVDPEWLDLGCSMLEMLIGLSRRLSFQVQGQPRDWFWHLLTNLDIREYNDYGVFPDTLVDETIDNVIWRTYKSNGRGGLFPLRRPKQDQREVELWYQLNSYVLEMN